MPSVIEHDGLASGLGRDARVVAVRYTASYKHGAARPSNSAVFMKLRRILAQLLQAGLDGLRRSPDCVHQQLGLGIEAQKERACPGDG